MLTDKKILGKLEQIEQRYNALRFQKISDVPAELVEIREYLRAEPEAVDWRPAPAGTRWGGDWVTAWFRDDVTLPPACDGQKVFIRARTGGETLFLVDGEQRGVFDDNHPVVMLALKGVSGRTHHMALEAYSGHTIPGCMPQDQPHPQGNKSRTFDGIELLLEREDVTAFVFDLRVLRQVMQSLDENSLRRNALTRELAKVYALVDAMPEETGESSWRPKLAQARSLMRPLLEARNGPTTPRFGIIGHSHIDTAWLWPLAETWRKCARTFSSTLNLMEQYPELLFIQSQPCQTEVIRDEYPGIFQRIQHMVAAGRWEPNGSMWVEPDCNIPSGESFVRQLLVGQRTTRAFFNYTADTLWLPDVFGYSAALPQILRGCGVDFFCTTKISWNDTTRFPYDTFVWKGIDGSSVIAHYNAIHCWPDPATLTQQWNWVQHKDVQDRRLSAFGYGDGGGGPMAEMAEVARRVRDLEGCSRTEYTTVSNFMRAIRAELPDLPEWSGELYLELHRGTLTSIAEIKRGNRQTEMALRNAELLCTLATLRGADYPATRLLGLWKTLLTNQFHDILPGSSIAEVNDLAIDAFHACTTEARDLAVAALHHLAPAGTSRALIANSLSWERVGELTLTGIPPATYPEDSTLPSQWIEDVSGQHKLIVAGVKLPALGVASLPLSQGGPTGTSPFMVTDQVVETPHAHIRFDEAGRILSFVLKASGREIVHPGGALNTFLMGEDIPEAWDNWDIDRDQQFKLHAEDHLVWREIVANGPLQLRLRSRYRIGTASTLTQDMVLHATTPQVDFETVLDWHEKHMLLKAGFHLDVLADTARHEIQYGHVERPTHINLPQDRARFEVCAHKWSDLSDNGFGVALLNDCKYGVGINGSDIRLSLMKSGTHPDARGDAGQHVFTYSLLPHAGPFSVEAVVRPAYELNVPLVTALAGPDAKGAPALASVDTPNVIVESVKWAEDGNAFVMRVYEAGKISGKVHLTLHVPVKQVSETNMLEEHARPLSMCDGAISLLMHPFEIKT
ncbi:MAG: glycosyl hydrolase-related protein, partial [Chloroflexi bacterium]|nr:glycosyl hydrolase-related protein [Chloroflexota bacterium]